MLVLKFGGTSVGSIENMTNVKNIINDGNKKIVVLSAMSGTTNALVEISENIRLGNSQQAQILIDALQAKYAQVVTDLLQNESLQDEATQYVQSVIETLQECIKQRHTPLLYNRIVAQGELLSTFLFSRFLQQEGISAQLMPALEFMRVD